MIVYLIGMVVSAFFVYLREQFSDRLGRNVLGFMAFLPMTLIAALRYDVGTDYLTVYAPGFRQIASGVAPGLYDIGFQSFNQFIALFTNDYVWLFAAVAVIFGGLTYRNIFRQSVNPLMSVILYATASVYFLSLNIIRQMLAISVLFSAVPLIEKRQPVWFGAAVALAASLHISSLLFLPLYFLWHIEWTRKRVLLITCVGCLLAPFGMYLAEWILPLFGQRYQNYLLYPQTRSTWSLAISLLMFIMALAVKPKDSKVMLIVGLNVVGNVLTWFIPLMARVITMFHYGIMLYFPSVLESIEDRKLRLLVKIGCTVCFIVYACITVGVKGGFGVIPYQTIFSR